MPLSNVNPANYQSQLDTKVEAITYQFAEFNPPAIDVYASPAVHFRVRAEFKVWHSGSDIFFAMFKKDQPKTPVRIENFPIGAAIINRLMEDLIAEIKQSDLLRHKLFQMEFLTTLSGEALVTFIYHKRLSENWQRIAEQLQIRHKIKIIGRSRKQKLVLSDDYVTETLTIDNRPYYFQQIESSFTQPNASVNQKMLTWALRHSKNSQGDLLELYCGNGNFTMVLANNFDKVLATEISKTSVRSAHHNAELNEVKNLKVVRMSSEDFTSALNGRRAFRRLKNTPLEDYNFSTVFVDPPRSGLDSDTEGLVSRFEKIIYISCNPDTLYKNLRSICNTHSIEQFAIFDQFPYTDHIECGVMLTRKNNKPD